MMTYDEVFAEMPPEWRKAEYDRMRERRRLHRAALAERRAREAANPKLKGWA